MKRDENDDPPSRDDVVTRMDVDSDVTLKGVRNRLLIFGPTIVVGLLGAWDGRIPPVLLWSIIGAGVLIGVVAVAGMVVGVSVLPEGIELRRLIGIRALIRADRIDRVIFVREYATFGDALAPLVIVVGLSGRPLCRLSGHVFNTAQLAAFAAATGPYEALNDGAVSSIEFGKRFRRLVPFWERRPLAWGFSATGVIIVVIVAVYALLGEFSRS